MKKRRRARELALQVLYACETGRPDDRLDAMATIAESGGYSDEARLYAFELVSKVWESQDIIDSLIVRHAVNWDLKRMAAIDRNILRLAAAELRMDERTPPKVVMDEAVELAKTYSTEESSRFVNGIVDSIYREISGNGNTEIERKP
jgi:N utilization substance protein B